MVGGYFGVPPIQTWDGVPSRPGMEHPHPDLGWGIPHPNLGCGTPTQTWDGVPPHPDLGWVTPPTNGEQTDIPKYNKKVLLHERKRHTTHCIASTHCAALSNPDLVQGGLPSPRSGRVPSPKSGGYPIPGPGGYPIPGPGGRTPIPCPRGTPSKVQGGGTPSQVWGVPHPMSGGVPHFR